MDVTKDSNSKMDTTEWLQRFFEIQDATCSLEEDDWPELERMVLEGTRLIPDSLPVDTTKMTWISELIAELQRQQVIIARIHDATGPDTDSTDIALRAMFLSFGFPEADILTLIIRAQTVADTHLMWESMEDQFGVMRVRPFRPAELCDGIHVTDEIVVKRKNRGDKSRSIRDQSEIQRFSHTELTPKNGYTLLFTPQAWDCALAPAMRHTELHYERWSYKQYEMERIDDSNQIMDMPPDIAEECAAYEKAIKGQHLWPRGYKLFRQPDGRVALISFGKFGAWDGTTIEFPWGDRVTPP